MSPALVRAGEGFSPGMGVTWETPSLPGRPEGLQGGWSPQRRACADGRVWLMTVGLFSG